MIRLKSPPIRSLNDLVLFRYVPELNHGDEEGYVENWYTGGKERYPDYPGINVEDAEVLEYARIVSCGQGIFLGNSVAWGIIAENKFYDIRSFLVNGVVVSNLIRKEEFGKEGSGIRVSDSMPSALIRIISERSQRLIETARLLKLPVDKVELQAA
jgi:hypothetical protein